MRTQLVRALPRGLAAGLAPAAALLALLGAPAAARADARRAGPEALALAAPGFNQYLQLRSAPFDRHPDVYVHAPPGFDPRGPVHVVLFLHGWLRCVGSLPVDRGPCVPGDVPRRGLELARRFDDAHVNALLVVPQLAYLATSGAPGRLGAQGGLRAMLAELLAHPALRAVLGGRARDVSDLGRVVAMAHSGGYAALDAVLSRGGVEVHEVHYFDAYFGMSPALAAWARAHAADLVAGRRRIAAYYTDYTAHASRALPGQLARVLQGSASDAPARGGGPAPALPPGAVLLRASAASHALVPREQFTDALREAGLPSLQQP